MIGPPLEELAGDFVVDPTYSRLGFIARHAMVTRVHGEFQRFSGLAHLDPKEPTGSWVLVKIEAASVSTGIRQRDAHLRTSDFLDVPHHPLMVYRASQVERVGRSVLTFAGDLTMRGITHPLPLDFHYHGAVADTPDGERLVFAATAEISRRAWGVSWSGALEAGGIVVADKVTLELEVHARRVESHARTQRASPTAAELGAASP
jgi:polyisoprenoid-binding protein YceI